MHHTLAMRPGSLLLMPSAATVPSPPRAPLIAVYPCVEFETASKKLIGILPILNVNQCLNPPTRNYGRIAYRTQCQVDNLIKFVRTETHLRCVTLERLDKLSTSILGV